MILIGIRPGSIELCQHPGSPGLQPGDLPLQCQIGLTQLRTIEHPGIHIEQRLDPTQLTHHRIEHMFDHTPRP